MTVSEKITDHPGFEPGTLALLAPRSTNWANVSDGEERSMFISIGLQFLPRIDFQTLFLSFLDEKMLEGRGKNWRPIDINIDRSSPSDTLAQLVERGASNAKVPGSNPGWSVIFFADCHLCCVVE